MKEMANHKIQLLYDDWHRIDLIMRGHFQRRVRKAWLKYKERKAEKKRKKAEAAAAKKGKFGGRRAPSKKAAPAAPKPPPKPTTSSTTSPEKKELTSTIEPPAIQDKPSDPNDPLSQTVVNINLKSTLVPDGLELKHQNSVDEGIQSLLEGYDVKQEVIDADGNQILVAPGGLQDVPEEEKDEMELEREEDNADIQLDGAETGANQPPNVETERLDSPEASPNPAQQPLELEPTVPPNDE